RKRLLYTKNAVFCYMGHGMEDSRLEFESDTGGSECISVDDLAKELRGRVHLALLSACHSHRSAYALVQQGVPFAIGAINKITDQVARTFTKEFLQSLWLGKTIAEALDRARKGVQDVDQRYPQNAGVMVLYSFLGNDDGDGKRYLQTSGQVDISEPRW